MIKIETGKQDNHRIYSSTIQGNFADVLYDSAVVIRGIYDALERHSHDNAEMFRRFVARCTSEDDFWTADNSGADAVFMDLSNVKKGGGQMSRYTGRRERLRRLLRAMLGICWQRLWWPLWGF